MSLALGFAGGVLMGTISFEMIPQALSLSSLTLTVAGFVTPDSLFPPDRHQPLEGGL